MSNRGVAFWLMGYMQPNAFSPTGYDDDDDDDDILLHRYENNNNFFN